MVVELRKTYFTLLVPVVIGLVLIYLAKTYKFLAPDQIAFLNIVAALTFILSVVSAIGLPVFIRSLFSHKMRDRTSVSREELIKFERTLIIISMVTPYLTLIGYLLEFPRFYFSGTVLTTLYALYYYYPSEKRIQFDKRIFRVREMKSPQIQK
jgi:hypothetical protein